MKILSCDICIQYIETLKNNIFYMKSFKKKYFLYVTIISKLINKT